MPLDETGGQAFATEQEEQGLGDFAPTGEAPPVETPPAEVPGIEAPPEEEADLRFRDTNPGAFGGSAPGGVPPIPPVPQVPPPPVSFQLGGQGGGASSFARPGSAAARPFRSSQFLTSRAEGGGASERRAGFGAGAALAGGGVPPVADFNSGGDAGGLGDGEDDELARILAQVAGRYQPGGGQ